MGGGTYTPRQQNWRWYTDATPDTSMSALANENVKPTLANNSNIIRLRVTIAEVGAKADNAVTLSVQYDTDSGFPSPQSLGAAPQHWNYANGAGTEGSAVDTQLLTDATTKNEYCESGTNVVAIAANSANEIDIAIQATANVSGSTTYYFRIVGDGTAIPLGSGEIYPQVLTAAALLTKSLSDTITLTDEFSRTVAFVREFGDTITLSDGIGKKVIIPRADTIILSDDITTQRIINLQLSDTITLSDVILKTPKIALADTITLNDAVAKLMSKGLADTITLSDVLYNAIKMSLSDNITLTDDMAKKAAVVLADQMTLADLFDYIHTPGGGPAEKWMVYIIDKDTVVNIKL